MRMLVTLEFADAGTKSGTHRVLIRLGGAFDRGGPTNLGSFRGRDKWNSAGYAAAASG
jgi:hypothetical protein